MAPQRVPGDAPCPCGSGKQYQDCCYEKGFEWQENEDGDVFKSLPLSASLADILNEQREKFIEQFGREPGPDDHVFFDMPHLEHVEAQMVDEMKRAGINPAIIYAFEKTGLLVTEMNQHLIPAHDLDKWNAAISEFEAQHGRPQPMPADAKPEYPFGNVALYGPDDRVTTKIAAAVIPHEGAEPIIERWVGADVMANPQVQRELHDFFQKHNVQSVAMTDGNIGCPHDEGKDYPVGENCPFCPFWKGSHGSSRHE
jgi:hypothetical protein